MSRWGVYGRKDTQLRPDGDRGWRGIYMARDDGAHLSEVPPGYLARHENRRLIDGASCRRDGTAYPADFNPVFANKIIGSHIYSNPNGDEVMLIATANATYVWSCQFGKDPVQIPLLAGQNTGTGLVHFVQAFEKVLLLRYPFLGQPPLIWDWAIDDTQFKPVVLSGYGNTLIPATIMGVPFMNRILLYNPYYATAPWRDQVIMTDILDYTSYDPLLDTFRINAGESNLITSVLPWFKGAVVVFMRTGIHMLENFAFDPLFGAQRALNNRLGSVGIYGPLQVGAEAYFLSRTGLGIYRLSEVISEQIALQPVPLSRSIQPIIDRIDWDRAALYHSTAVLGDYAYFAVPLDRKTGASDAILVLNTVSGEWESAPDWWDDDTFRINRLHVTLYDGSPRVFGLDYAASKVYMLYDGLEDEVNNDSVPVHDRFASRGYVCGDPAEFKRFEHAIVGIRTFAPAGSVTAVSDGVNERKALGTIAKDHLKFYPHGHADFDLLTGDLTEPKREDYSTTNVDNVAIEDFEDLPDGPILALPGTATTGFIGVKQQSTEAYRIRNKSRWCSIEIENTQGKLDILGLEIEAIPARQLIRTAA